MRGCHRPILLAFITFLVNGLTYGQNNEPNCGTFCLAAEATCTCTLSEGSLTWEVRNANGDVIGQRTVDEGDEGTPTTLFGDDFEAASAFGITVISSTSGAFTSEMSFDTVSEYQGYEIECSVGDISSVRMINIADEPPTVAKLNLASFTTDSAVLTFESSVSGDCVVNYTITSNASVPSPISDTSVTISRPPNNAVNATYFVCVSAVNFAEETGPSSCLDCFRFTSPNAVIFHNDVTYAYTTISDVCEATIEWTPDSCLPVTTNYSVTINSSGVVTTSNVSAATLQISNVAYEEEYIVAVTPSNTFGFGMLASTTFIAPTDCPVMLERTSPSPTSGSASLLFPGSGVLPVGLIAGFILSFGFSAVML